MSLTRRHRDRTISRRHVCRRVAWFRIVLVLTGIEDLKMLFRPGGRAPLLGLAMSSPFQPTSPSNRVRIVVATSVMLTFISYWRAAAIVLNDLASSAFYACGIAEQAVGKSAPWFIVARDAVFIHGARRLRGKLLDVRPRRRLSSRQRSTRRNPRQTQRLRPDV